MKKQIITIIALAIATSFQAIGQNRIELNTTGEEERNPVPVQSHKPNPGSNPTVVNTFCPVINTLNVLDKGSDLATAST